MRIIRTALSLLIALPLLTAASSAQQTAQSTRLPSPPKSQADASHAFDRQIGMWKTHVKRLVQPLSGSKEWAEYDGTSKVSSIWNGRANLVELQVDGPHGHLELLSLRLFDPAAQQWSLNVASSKGGRLGVPTVGQFLNGQGEFYDQEEFNGRMILVRFVITSTSEDSFHFEQAFSGDGGKTWEVNWIADDIRAEYTDAALCR